MDDDKKRERYMSVVVAVNFTIVAGYAAFGMPPAPGGLKQIIGGGAVAIVGWLSCAFTWLKTRSTDPPKEPPDRP